MPATVLLPVIDLFSFNPWQMTLGERAALEGVLSQLKPRLSIEIGTAEGGSLRRIAAHSEEVHSFDLVEPSLPVTDWGEITLHTGDSHVLLPEFLAELGRAGRNVDFVMVDGDHSADGVEKDVNDLLSSPAIRRTVLLLHDTGNEEVRRGLDRVPIDQHDHVAYWNPDFVSGHLSHGGSYHLQLWGGLGLLMVDADHGGDDSKADAPVFYGMLELLTRTRDALAAAETEGLAIAPGGLPELRACGALDSQVAEAEHLRSDLANARMSVVAMQRSLSWRLTAPLRQAKRFVRGRTGRSV